MRRPPGVLGYIKRYVTAWPILPTCSTLPSASNSSKYRTAVRLDTPSDKFRQILRQYSFRASPLLCATPATQK